MLAVSLFDTSGIMLRDWALGGFDTIALDLAGTNHVDRYGVTHVQGDALDVWRDKTLDHASIIFGFPPCTDLAISGSRHWKRKGPKRRADAMTLVYVTPSIGIRAGIPWMIENPRSPSLRANGGKRTTGLTLATMAGICPRMTCQMNRSSQIVTHITS